jgi:hypothetical protein
LYRKSFYSILLEEANTNYYLISIVIPCIAQLILQLAPNKQFMSDSEPLVKQFQPRPKERCLSAISALPSAPLTFQSVQSTIAWSSPSLQAAAIHTVILDRPHGSGHLGFFPFDQYHGATPRTTAATPHAVL